MDIIISGRHIELTDELRQYTEEKFSAFADEYHKLTHLRIVFAMERGWHLVEAHISGKHIDMEAKSRTRDMYASIDETFDKLQRQLRKHLEKVHTHRESQLRAEMIKDEMPEMVSEEDHE